MLKRFGKALKKTTANINQNWDKQQAEAKERRDWERQVKKEALQVQKQEFRTQYSKQMLEQAKIKARLQARANVQKSFAPKQSPIITPNPTFEALLYGKPKATTPQPMQNISQPKTKDLRQDSKEVQVLKQLLKKAQKKQKPEVSKAKVSKGGQKKPGIVPDIFYKY